MKKMFCEHVKCRASIILQFCICKFSSLIIFCLLHSKQALQSHWHFVCFFVS